TSVLSAQADSAGAVTETNETNNSRNATVIANIAQPDLIVSNLSWSPGTPTAGDTVTLTATVRNQGGAALPSSTPFSTAFSLGGTVAVSLTTDLLPGASTTVQTTWTAVAGSHTLSATADSGGAVAEDDETNNTRSSTLTVRQALPDLQPYYRTWQDVSGLSFNPSQPVAGGAVTVTCDIYNSGTMALTSGRTFDVIFSANGSAFATNHVILAADLAPGAKIQTAAVWTSVTAGNAVIAVAVDTNSEVIEENETNNGTAAGLTIYPAAAAVVAADLISSPLQPLPGAAVTLTATVRNDGAATGGNGMTVEFFAGSTNLADRLGTAVVAADVPAMGGYGTVTYNWTAPSTPGNVTLYAMVNGTTVQRTLTITPNPAPNLQVFSEDISVSPALPQMGEAVMVSAKVRNTEGSAASNFRVRFSYDTPAGQWLELGTPVTVAALAVGSNTTITAAAPLITQRSAYSVKVEILPNAVQGDADTGDNTATSSFLLANTPMANAGTDATCFVGQPVALNGTTSRNATVFTWSLIEKPADSTAAVLSADTTAHPSFTPDKPGIYRARLIVGGGLLQSTPDTVTITARWINLTLRPGLYGTIVGADPDGNITRTVAYGVQFPTVVVTPSAGFISAGWTPTSPTTVVGDIDATVRYRPDAAVIAAEQIRAASTAEQQTLGLYTEESIGTIVAGPLLIAVDPLTHKINLNLQLQRNDTLDPTTWQPLGSPTPWTDTTSANKAFYR
ncbi:MAG: CARDB domain-containing protein, partial [Verrucomicrobiota bacterium]